MKIPLDHIFHRRPAGRQPVPGLLQTRATLEDLLTRNLLGWWYPQTIEAGEGGYRLNHDAGGVYRGPAPKSIVTQARMVWFLSMISRAPYGGQEHLEAARHGFAFLRDRLWDDRHGGFYWQVDPAGRRAIRREKHLYGQAFGLFALSEYATASGDRQAEALARELFGLMERHAHDAVYGGYRELFERDWTFKLGTANPMESRVPPDAKLANTHLHLLEALTAYHAGTDDPVARDRLIELISVLSVAIVRPEAGACTDKFAADWTPLPGHDRVSYGHNLETVSLLIRACHTVGLPAGPLRPLFETIWGTALRDGFDAENGGFFDSAPFGSRSDRLDKIFWVQAEGLLSALEMYRLTGDEKYFTCFQRTLDWIAGRQADWEHGSWHMRISADGRTYGDKAGLWGDPYHQGRALVSCLRLLDDLATQGAGA